MSTVSIMSTISRSVNEINNVNNVDNVNNENNENNVNNVNIVNNFNNVNRVNNVNENNAYNDNNVISESFDISVHFLRSLRSRKSTCLFKIPENRFFWDPSIFCDLGDPHEYCRSTFLVHIEILRLSFLRLLKTELEPHCESFKLWNL